MQDRFKFRAVLKTDKFTILVETFYILNSCYFIDINKAEVEFKCKYPDECFWDFIEEIEKQDYIQEISIDGDLIITKDFTNLVQCTGLKDKNGKLIYEGDVVTYDSRDLFPHTSVKTGKITWYKHHWVMSYYDKNCVNAETQKPALQNMWLGCDDFINSRIEVIGNIYQDKELLSEVE